MVSIDRVNPRSIDDLVIKVAPHLTVEGSLPVQKREYETNENNETNENF
jgi:hypothetical protein